MNSKSDSSSTSSQGENPTSQADEILKQFHPELFHKKKLEEGKGLKQSSPPPASTQTKPAPKKNVKVAQIHDQGKKSKALNRPSFSISDMMYTITSALSDLLEGMANLVPRTFIRAVVNIYTGIALAILIPCGIFFYIWYTTPPFFITDYCHKRFAEIHREFLNYRAESASDEKWEQFITKTEDEMDEMIYNLESTSDVDDQIRQLIMWAGRDNLLVMIQEKGKGTQKEEANYKKYYRQIDMVQRDIRIQRERQKRLGR